MAAGARTGRDGADVSPNTRSWKNVACSASNAVVVAGVTRAAAASSGERSGRATSARTRARSLPVATPRRTCSVSLAVSEARAGAATIAIAATAANPTHSITAPRFIGRWGLVRARLFLGFALGGSFALALDVVIIVIVIVIIVVVVILRKIGGGRLGRGRLALFLGLLPGLFLGGAKLSDLLHDGGLRRDDDRHRARFHHRARLDVGDVFELLEDDVELLVSLFGVRDLAAAEANRELHLVAALEEPPRRLHFEVDVVIVGLGPELDLLDLDDRLVAPRLRLLLLLLVLVLAEVEDLANGGLGLGIDLDQIEALLQRHAERFVGLQHAQHAAVGSDDAHFGNADAVIDSDLVPALLLARVEPGECHCGLLDLRNLKNENDSGGRSTSAHVPRPGASVDANPGARQCGTCATFRPQAPAGRGADVAASGERSGDAVGDALGVGGR